MNATEIKGAARGLGADAVGIADLALLEGIETQPADLLAGYERAVSMAVRLSDPVLDAIDDRPTPLYQQHYRIANDVLDGIAFKLAQWIAAKGCRVLPLPASQILDADRLTSSLSHKAVAVAAGIGWQGKSLLTVHPKFGPRLRLVTVLTDADVAPDKPLKNRCGACDACTKACPAGAIRNVRTKWHYQDREEAVDLGKCLARVTENKALPHIGSLICGVCVAACPWGRP